MPDPILEDPPTIDEPAAIDPTDPPPGSEQSNKAMAEKFRQLMSKTPPSAPDPAPAPPAPPKAAEPPKEPAKDAEPEDVPEPPANQPVTRDHFKKLSQAKDEYKKLAKQQQAAAEDAAKKAKSLEEELAKVKSALPPNLEEVQKSIAESARILEENKKLTEQLETVSLERSPKFQQWWKSETSKHVKIAQSRVPPEQQEALGKLLMEPASSERDAAIDDIVSKLPGVSQRLINGALESLENLRIQRDEALQKGSERFKELQAHEAAEREKEEQTRTQKLQMAIDRALLHAKGFDAFKPTGDPANDAEIRQREAFVRAAVSGKLDADVLLQMPAMAVDYLTLRDKTVPALKDEIAKRDTLIKQLQGASPSPSGGSAPKATPKQPSESAQKGQGFAEHVRTLMAGK